MGINEKQNVIYLIDFGLAEKYQNSKGKHINKCIKNGLVGTASYASLNAHLGFEQSRKDDLESLFFVLVYLSTGNLPWMKLNMEDREERIRKIMEIKLGLN